MVVRATETPPEITTTSPVSARASASAVASRSSGTISTVPRTAPERLIRPETEYALELRIAPGRSGSPGSWSSSPVVRRRTTRGRRAQATSPRPTETSTPASAGPISSPAASTASPAAMSSPARLMSRPTSTSTRISTSCDPASVSSTRTTASAPSGTIAPVEIATASPSPSRRCAGCPARDSSTTRRRAPPFAPGVSAARTA